MVNKLNPLKTKSTIDNNNYKRLFGKIFTIIKINNFGTKIQAVLHQAVTASAEHSIK